MTDHTIALAFEDAQRLFDLAVGADQAASGYMDSDDVAVMRRLAVAIGVDPQVCTGEEFRSQFPHRYEPGFPSMAEHRRSIMLVMPGTASASDIVVTRPETDDEVLKRLGGTLVESCQAGRGRRCGKPIDDLIHKERS